MNKERKIKVLLANEYRIVREALRLLFSRQSDIEVLAGEEVDKTVLQLARELRPDVIIIDINITGKDNIELSRQILNSNPNIRIIANPDRIHVHLFNRGIRAGISGFVLKACGFDELDQAVRIVCENKIYICNKTKDILANDLIGKERTDYKSETVVLSKKESEIIRLLSMGMTSKAIAQRLNVSSKTVDVYRRRITSKLGINSMAELIEHDIRN